MQYRVDTGAKCSGNNVFQMMTSNTNLASSSNENKNHHISIKLGYLYSAGNPSTGQEIHMKYDESSTTDNPVMLVEGKDMGGKEFKKKINLNDIDIANASTVEMTALNVHLAEQGDETVKFHVSIPLATMGNQYDINDKMNFQSFFQKWAESLYGIGYEQKANAYMGELERYLFFHKNSNNDLLNVVFDKS